MAEPKIVDAEYKTEKEVESTERMQKAIGEINEVQAKYKVALIAQMAYMPEGIIPKISIIDTKEKDDLQKIIKDKIK